MEKDVAEQIKKEFDKNHGPTWHCIVGKNFGKLKLLSDHFYLYNHRFIIPVVAVWLCESDL